MGREKIRIREWDGSLEREKTFLKYRVKIQSKSVKWIAKTYHYEKKYSTYIICMTVKQILAKH